MTLNHSTLCESGCKLPCQKFIATQALKAKNFILEDAIDEATKSGQSSNRQFLYEEWCLLCVYVEELGLGKLLAKDFKMFVHDFASLEVFVVEVNDSSLEFGDVV